MDYQFVKIKIIIASKIIILSIGFYTPIPYTNIPGEL